jgi:hypothetical protein
MMGFIHDEQRARSKFAEYVPQPGDVIFFREQAVENDKPRTGGPRVDAEALKPSQVGRAHDR